jgi:hypothetical protein
MVYPQKYKNYCSTLVGQLYGVPHGILRVSNTILYENEFQNPQIFQQTISLFPEHSTLALHHDGRRDFFDPNHQVSELAENHHHHTDE